MLFRGHVLDITTAKSRIPTATAVGHTSTIEANFSNHLKAIEVTEQEALTYAQSQLMMAQASERPIPG